MAEPQEYEKQQPVANHVGDESHFASKEPSALDAEKSHPTSENDAEDHDELAAEKEQTGEPLEPVDTAGYATGVKLISIIVAVVLAIFLVALDMTSQCSPSPLHLARSC